MPTRCATAVWKGTLIEGKGKMELSSGSFEGAYSFASRFEEKEGTNPEELIGAAHAGCFSMALSHELGKAGYSPKTIRTDAKVILAKAGEGFRISEIELSTNAEVPDIDEQTFLKHAENAKNNCPVSQLCKGAEIKLEAKLNP